MYTVPHHLTDVLQSSDADLLMSFVSFHIKCMMCAKSSQRFNNRGEKEFPKENEGGEAGNNESNEKQEPPEGRKESQAQDRGLRWRAEGVSGELRDRCWEAD